MSRPTTKTEARALEVAGHVAQQMFQRFRREIPLDEIKSLAMPAAVHAASLWDGRGSLPKYLVQRTRWAVLDGLRRERRRAAKIDAPAIRHMATLNTERAAEIAAHEDEAAPGRADPAAAFGALLRGAATSFTIDLDAAGVLAVPDPNEDVEANVVRMRVRRAVAELPEPERSVLERHGYAGETFEEIAVAGQMHRSTVFSTYTRALEKLRQTFESAA